MLKKRQPEIESKRLQSITENISTYNNNWRLITIKHSVYVLGVGKGNEAKFKSVEMVVHTCLDIFLLNHLYDIDTTLIDTLQ